MTKRWITVDPGESCGLAVWEDDKLILGYTLEMGVVDIMLHYALIEKDDQEVSGFLDRFPECIDFFEQIHPADYEIERVVMEDFRLYPWVIYTPDGRATHALDFDQFRTCRLIGAITHVCRISGVPVHLQPASIKEQAVAGGAENLYYKPLHENRHQNDAIQHGVYWLIIEERRAPKDARI